MSKFIYKAYRESLFMDKKTTKRCSPFFILLLLSILAIPSKMSFAQPLLEKSSRPSILAGTWYPSNRNTLKSSIESYLAQARQTSLEGNLKGLLVPHAGHKYSGRVAASAYSLLKGSKFKRIIMIGPSHRTPFRGISVNTQSSYETPLGTVPVDQSLAKRLIETGTEIRCIPQAHAHEHALEIQLPFLQTVLKNFQIVPLLMGQQDMKTCRHLVRSLFRALDSIKGTLFLASTDLSHFHPARQAERLDRLFIDGIKAFDTTGLSKSLAAGNCEACGGGAAMTVMLAVRKVGANRSIILDYAHSGHVTGDLEQVVGYLSAAFIESR